MPLVIEAASATQFSLDHAKAVIRGLEGSFRAGGCTNKAPQGYRNVRDPLNLKKGLVERDPERFDVIRKAWDLVLTGGSSLKHVTATLNGAWGFRTRPTRNGGNRPLSYSGAYFMFTNPFYAGFVHRKGELVQGNHEPMVTPEEFERAQAMLHRTSFEAPRVKEYAYTGLMRCAHCGQQITGEVKRLRDGRLWENYHCSDANLTCTKRGLSREKVETLIFTKLATLEIDPILLEAAGQSMRRYLHQQPQSSQALMRTQEAELEECTKRLQRLSDMWLDGVLTDPNRYRELELKELTRKNELLLAQTNLRSQAETTEKNLSRSLSFLVSVRSALKQGDQKRKKEICRALATSYVFDGRSKTIEIEIHPLLKELVSFARHFSALEPGENGSDKQRKLPLVDAVFVGGEFRDGLECFASMHELLKNGLFSYCLTTNGDVLNVARQ
jgi:site-specific DNA recombinase